MEENGILYEREYTFTKLPKLRFDFYLPHHNVVIEYDGKQHFQPVKIFGGKEEFRKVKNRNKLKDDFCLENRIKMIRIPYWENDIEKYLEDVIFKNKQHTKG